MVRCNQYIVLPKPFIDQALFHSPVDITPQ